MQSYKTSLDTNSKILTGIILLGGIIFFRYVSFNYQWPGVLIFCIGFLGFLIPPYLGSVRSYGVDSINLVIRRPLSIFNKNISLLDIQSVRLISEEDMEGFFSIGFYIKGSLFGYRGNCVTKKLGYFRLLSANLKNPILLEIKPQKSYMKWHLVISPDDVGMFDVLQNQMKPRE